jgi:hypothetical protein
MQSSQCMQCVVVRQRRMTSEDVEAELTKRDTRAEELEGKAVIGESALEQLKLECSWAMDAYKRAKEELAARKTQKVLSFCWHMPSISASMITAHPPCNLAALITWIVMSSWSLLNSWSL